MAAISGHAEGRPRTLEATLYIGDMRDRLAAIADESIDAIVTDPPYHLTSGKKGGSGFMGKKWDGGDIAFRPETWAAMLRVAKPGAHLIAFGGARTFHRMWCAIEDAGWEIRDTLMWLYGQGFPKSSNQDGEWAGWGTALKPSYEPVILARKSSQDEAARFPSFEPIVLARKPLAGTVAENLQRYRVGALNIDGCRVQGGGDGGERDGEESAERRYTERGGTNFAATPGPRGGDARGRWPANVLHDGSDEVVAAFPDSDGHQGDVRGTEPRRPTKNVYGEYARTVAAAARGDSGSAARFFWCPKASRADRNEGLEDLLSWESEDQSRAADVLLRLRKATSDAMTLLRGDCAWSTTSYGSDTTARFRAAIRSIIETTTKPTTQSATSNFLPPSSISDCIQDAIATATEHGSSLAELAAFTSQWKRSSTDEGTASVLDAVHAALQVLCDLSASARRGNGHPTVKPTELMQYLCRLVAPRGARILDPFMGSGSTGKAAVLEGMDFVGIEGEPEYVEIARRRIGSRAPLLTQLVVIEEDAS